LRNISCQTHLSFHISITVEFKSPKAQVLLESKALKTTLLSPPKFKTRKKITKTEKITYHLFQKIPLILDLCTNIFSNLRQKHTKFNFTRTSFKNQKREKGIEK